MYSLLQPKPARRKAAAGTEGQGSKLLSLYRVHFKWKEKEIQLTAKSLDLTHPYFVSIKDLVFPKGKKLIINPAEDEIIKTFGFAKHLMIPFQAVSLIEEIAKADSGKVMHFPLAEDSRKKDSDD